MNIKLEKICVVCKELKPIDRFYNKISSTDGKCSLCKSCSYKRTKIWVLLNKDQKNQKNRLWYIKNKSKVRYLQKISYHKNKQNKQLRIKIRLKTDPAFKIRINLARRILLALKGNQKLVSTLRYLGCSLEFIKIYLLYRYFDIYGEKLDWQNFLKNGRKYHIDHIKPCSSFDLSKLKQQRKCFHWTNLQILKAKDNLEKGDKILC